MKALLLALALISVGTAQTAFSASDSKYVSKEAPAPIADENTVTPQKAEVVASNIFCGIAGKDCDPAKLKAACLASQDKGAKLHSFKCLVITKDPEESLILDALRVQLDRDLLYISSERAKRPPQISSEYETLKSNPKKNGRKQ